jgi:hypothetical protein
LTGEGDPFAVGRELSEDLDAGMRGEASGKSAGRGSEPEIAGVSENNLVAVNVGKAKEFRLGVGICGEDKSETQAQDDKQLARRHERPFHCTMYQASAEQKEGIQQARLTPREWNELYTELRGGGGSPPNKGRWPDDLLPKNKRGNSILDCKDFPGRID